MTNSLEKYVDPRAQLPLSAARQLDEICEQFEQDLRAARDVSIESLLQRRPEQERPALLRELLALEFEYRQARGEPICSETYEARFPGNRQLIAMLIDECAAPSSAAAYDAETPAVDESAALFHAHSRYRFIRLLGRGGMGSVFLAEHRAMQRLVAIKAIRPKLISQSSVKQRFAREITAAARLVHPNIVTAYDAEQLGEITVLVMEYVDGQDLARLVADQGPASPQVACDWIGQAASGMQHSHDMGMVHRDLKPDNLMLTAGGQIKILDFGLARFASQSVEELDTATLLGSIDYMAPEQAADPHSAGAQADIYSLGCTLYFLLTGHPPFPTGSPSQRLSAHAEIAPSCPEGLPPGLWPVLERMLAKRPADRFQQPREIAAALQPWSAGNAPVRHDATENPARREARQLRPRSWPALAGSIALLLLAGTCFLLAGGSPTIPARAQRLLEQAEFQLGQRNETSTTNAIDRLHQAIAAAPGLAPPHVALSNAYNLQGDYGWAMPDDVFPLAKASALRALELDSHSASAHLALAFAMHAYECDAAQAEQEFRRALQLDPRSAEAHHWYAWFLLQQSRLQEAEQQIDLAAQLGAAKSIVATNEGRIRYFSGAYRLAIEKFEEALRLDPIFAKTRLDLGQTYAELGQLDAALQQFDRSPGLTDDGRDVIAARGYALARCGKQDEARQLLASLESRSQGKPLAYEIATIYAALQDRDAAFTWLEEAFQQQSAWRTYVQIDPRLKNLRSDLRFDAYLQAAGF